MTDSAKQSPPFDVFSLSKDFSERFNWSRDDLDQVMQQLIPAALSGFQHFGQPLLQHGSRSTIPSHLELTPFFGPEPVQQELVSQVAKLTGLKDHAIREVMPVAATLVAGQLARPYIQGEARNLLDAFLRGFARGRPKPPPGPIDYFNAYTETVQSFWSGFAQGNEKPETQPNPAAEEKTSWQQDMSEKETTELDRFAESWMSLGKDLQSTQVKQFSKFFDEVTKSVKS